MTKLTINEVADLLGCSSLPSEVDYRITECATKGVAAIVYFYEEPLPELEQKTTTSIAEAIRRTNEQI
jgi:hypothetical protein|tara:strand:+ start:114 stop:317 length:204 start_codon:yes stop_codon:yes gene_type:complete